MRRRHLRQEGSLQEEALRALVGLLEDLACEVVEDQLARLVGRLGSSRGASIFACSSASTTPAAHPSVRA